MASKSAGRFDPLFASSARSVRARLLTRHALSGAAIGLAVGLGAATLAWRLGRADLRKEAPIVVGAAGAIAGLVVARKKRWSDVDVALFLDERLATDEAITTAIDLRNEDDATDPARAVVLSAAEEALTKKTDKNARPIVFKPVHALLPVAAAGLVFVLRAPMPVHPILPPTPGVSTIQIADIEGLKHVAELTKVDARDEAQRERLGKIAKDTNVDFVPATGGGTVFVGGGF